MNSLSGNTNNSDVTSQRKAGSDDNPDSTDVSSKPSDFVRLDNSRERTLHLHPIVSLKVPLGLIELSKLSRV